MSATLLISAAFSLAVAATYAYVGLRLRRRRVGFAAQTAASLFAVWWIALSVSSALGATMQVIAALGGRDVVLFVSLTYLNLLVICVALWGLLYFLVYLFTGREGTLLPLTAFYVAYYILLVYFVATGNPEGVDVSRWAVAIRYEIEAPTRPLFAPVLYLLLLPQLVGAIAYFTVFFRTRDPTTRYRVALVSSAIIVWFLSTLLASVSGLGSKDWWQIMSRMIGLSAALTTLAAYYPPGWARRRFGVVPISDDPNEDTPSPKAEG